MEQRPSLKQKAQELACAPEERQKLKAVDAPGASASKSAAASEDAPCGELLVRVFKYHFFDLGYPSRHAAGGVGGMRQHGPPAGMMRRGEGRHERQPPDFRKRSNPQTPPMPPGGWKRRQTESRHRGGRGPD
eukprot:jgi/Mesen1/1000/ME000120S00164